jgi:hypothetical protein
MSIKNNNLHNARKEKNDEFYTQLVDIEQELQHYVAHFENKIVYCNCDSAESNFVKYFQDNFNALKLKDFFYSSDDFRSEKNQLLMQQSDIVVTNPPFSLFREFIAQLESYNKKYLIIGNLNAITYKDVFKLIKENKLWLGVSIKNGDREFRVPESYPLKSTGNRIDGLGNKYISVKGIRWFTNLDYKERHENLILYKKYNKNDYSTYSNYNAINVDKTIDIPINYSGIIGVPITFLDKYNPDQFQIIDINPHFFTIVEQGLPKPTQLKIEGKKDPYARILIKHKTNTK